MPKTDADWQALDDDIARKIMGWVKWDELLADNQELVPIYNRRIWLRLDDSDCPHSTGLLYKDWRPHENMSQAMQALEIVVTKGLGADFKIASHTVWASAICLTIKNWMDAQKELEDDSE